VPTARPAPDFLAALDRDLDAEQRQVAEALAGPVRVLAGAGTGKTRAVTYRIAHGVRSGAYDARRTLALTFTARAAGELRDRLGRLGVEGVSARTFHSAALRQLGYFWPRLSRGEFPTLLSSKSKVVAEAAAKSRLSVDPAIIRDLAAEIEWAKVSEVTPEAYPRAAAQRSTPVDLAEVARVYATYQDLMSARSAIDFEDVLLLTVAVMQSRADVADEIRAAYRWFTVDEYQDVSPLQHHLLDLWLGDRDEICVVGDAAQTIYTFAGATPAYLLDFTTRFPDATRIELTRSYRSTPQIVASANAALSGATAPLRSAGPWRVTLESERPTGPVPRTRSFDDEISEARGVARRITELVRAGVQPRGIAVLFRIHAVSPTFEAALDDAGIPYAMRGSERFFERPEVREAITRLRGAAKASSDDATARDEVSGVLAHMGWTPAAPAGLGAVRERWESLAALLALTEEFTNLVDLIAELDRRAQVEHAPTNNAVTLATLHAAKGLEWDAVFLVGLAEGMLPIAQATTPERVEEERRLFYVGMTRARTYLELSWARTRMGRGGRSRSRFLDDIRRQADDPDEPTITAGAHAPRRRAARVRGLATCRVCGKGLATGPERVRGRCRECPADVDEALLEALRQWRLVESRERKVPAYVIFTDATLEAIAEQRPCSDAELLAIPGIGAEKLARFGAAVVQLVASAPGETTQPED
jgi:DNA helicase-2/ATP-dependent DNA helicase PcrA